MKVGGQDIWQWSAPHTGHDERMKNATYYVADIEYVHWANSFPMEWFIMFVNINVAMFYITTQLWMQDNISLNIRPSEFLYIKIEA